MTRFSNLFRPLSLFVMMAAAVMSVSCDPKEDTKPGLTIDKTELHFTEAGGTETINLHTGTSWNASVYGAWLSLSHMGYTAGGDMSITLTVNPNTDSPKDRESQIVFVSGKETATLFVYQKGADIEDPSLPATAYEVSFLSSKGGFTVENKTVPSGLTDVWTQSTSYGMVASGRVGEVDGAAEGWLISPEIDLSERRTAFLSFSHVYRFCYAKVTDQLKLKITKDNGTTWTDVSIPKWPSGDNWNFINSGDIDLSSYCGSKIKIAFVYNSTAESCPTWEIKSVAVTREPSSSSDTGNQIKGTPTWLELPKINDGEKFIIHAVKDGSKNLRNYSMIFDTKALVAPWIAYPLCDSYTKKTVQRTDAWQADPFLSDKEQPNLYKSGDYYTNGFERGHQIASADRLASTALNEQTFYYSNMAPMYAGDSFNSGVWGNLEDKVRTWSSSKNGTDTLYVVTGCVTKNSTLTVKDNDNKVVTVPTGFYKVVLRYSKSSNENGGYCGAAFYLDHKKYSSVAFPSESVYSIDALEDKLGIDFFPNLEAIIGKDAAEKVESESPVYNSFWGLK